MIKAARYNNIIIVVFIILIEMRLKICRKTKAKKLCGIALH
jgi:hypothetical protein